LPPGPGSGQAKAKATALAAADDPIPTESVGYEMSHRRLSRHWQKTTSAVFLLALAAGPLGARAEPLDKEACTKLQVEKQTLVVLGVDKEFGKGADWAKANLPPAELNLVKRYLVIDEQLKFRCGLAVVTLQVPAEEPDDGAEEEGASPSGKGVPMPHRKAGTKPGAKQPAAAGAAKPASATVKAQTTPAGKPAPAKAAPKPAASKPQSSGSGNNAEIPAASPATSPGDPS
jgi:hypothetical protein